MSPIVAKLRSSKEKAYQSVLIVFGILLWILILLGVGAALFNQRSAPVVAGYVFYALLCWVFVLISAAAYRAMAFGNMLLLGPQQFLDLYQMVVVGSQEIGLPAPPKTFLYNSNGPLGRSSHEEAMSRAIIIWSVPRANADFAPTHTKLDALINSRNSSASGCSSI